MRIYPVQRPCHILSIVPCLYIHVCLHELHSTSECRSMQGFSLFDPLIGSDTHESASSVVLCARPSVCRSVGKGMFPARGCSSALTQFSRRVCVRVNAQQPAPNLRAMSESEPPACQTKFHIVQKVPEVLRNVVALGRWRRTLRRAPTCTPTAASASPRAPKSGCRCTPTPATTALANRPPRPTRSESK